MKRLASFAAAVLLLTQTAMAGPDRWRAAGWETDFSRSLVEFSEIVSGGPPRDGIPSIDDPLFAPAQSQTDLGPHEPLIRLEVDGEVRGYPLRILTWHEIVNDEIAGQPVAVTYCPLCNSAIVFERETETGELLEFGVSGLLRHSDMIMYDRQSQSWWQQFTGEGVVGEHAGQRLKMIPSRVVGFAQFVEADPGAQVLVPNDPRARPYGQNPYVGYDSRSMPYPLYMGDLPSNLDPMSRVVVVNLGEDIRAVTLSHLRERGRVEIDDIVLTWSEGVNSAVDSRLIAAGRDVGAVEAVRKDDGSPLVHDITFAFVVHAFHPGQTVLTEDGEVELTSR
jgi:hypothetical protein